MELKDRISPRYLEYCGCRHINYPISEDGLLFRKPHNRSLFVNLGDDGNIHCREFYEKSVFLGKGYDDSLADLVRENLLKIRGSQEEKFKVFDRFNDLPDDIDEDKRCQYIMTILNCLDINLSRDTDITDEIRNVWNKLREADNKRFCVEEYSVDEDTNMAIAISLYHTFTIYDIIGSKLSIQVRDYFNERFGRYEFRVKGVLEMINNLKITVESTDRDLSSNAYEEIREKLSYCNNILKN